MIEQGGKSEMAFVARRCQKLFRACSSHPVGNTSQRSVIVIGGGYVGVLTSFYLSRQGFKVVESCRACKIEKYWCSTGALCGETSASSDGDKFHEW